MEANNLITITLLFNNPFLFLTRLSIFD